MTLLIPLGLLGLSSVIALIVIYIIKPNYQHKEVTSTYVWKLSLKYRKKRLPSSKLRNIFLILCQVLALVAGALILSQPIIRDEKGAFNTEIVAVIDASASMRAEENGVTRFERAVGKVMDFANDTIDRGGFVSVILSDGKDRFLVQKAGIAGKSELNAKLGALITDSGSACSYASSNLDDAIALCEDVLKSNPTASVYLYTDTDYAYVPERMHVVNVASDSEWNVGILNAYAEFVEGYYSFFVELGCYGGVARRVRLNLLINGADGNDSVGKQNVTKGVVRYSADVELSDNSEKTVVFKNYKTEEEDKNNLSSAGAENIQNVYVGDDRSSLCDSSRVFAYSDVSITVDETDSFEIDDSFFIYGGRKKELKIQYATYTPKTFFTSMFATLRSVYAPYWEIKFNEVDLNTSEPAESGYDLYIYDGTCPSKMPGDGVVFIVDPRTSLPEGLIRRDDYTFKNNMILLEENYHPILRNVDAEKIRVSKCTRLSQYDSTIWKTLWSAAGNPVLLINDADDAKVILMLFDTEYSNLVYVIEYAFLFGNIFETFMPPTVRGNVFEVGQDVTLNARGNKLTMVYGSDSSEITELPSLMRFDKPGIYRLEPESYFPDKQLGYDEIFVKAPAAESNIFASGMALKAIYIDKDESDQAYQDLMVYFAAAMLALLFTEWFLQSQEAM